MADSPALTGGLVPRRDDPPPAVSIEPPGGGEGPALAIGPGRGDPPPALAPETPEPAPPPAEPAPLAQGAPPDALGDPAAMMPPRAGEAAPAPAPVQRDAVQPPAELTQPQTFAPRSDQVQVAGGLRDLFGRLGRVVPDTMPAPRAHDFVDVTRRGQLAIRQASEQEAQEIAQIVGEGASRRFNLISMRGDYTPEDVQRFIDAVRQANPDLFDAAKRGVRTREETIAAAERIGLDGAAQRLLTRKPGETFSAEELTASVLAVQNAFSETQRAATAVAATRGTAGSPDAVRQFGLNLAFTAALVAQANGATAEAGRALGMLGQLTAITRQSPADMNALVRRFGEAGGIGAPGTDPTAAIVDMLGGEAVLRTQAAAWVALPDPAARARFAQASLGRRTADAIIEAYINSLLTLPTTHLVNILGNASFGLWSIPERFLAGAVGTGRRFLHLGSDEQVRMGEAFAQMSGIYHGIGDAFRLAGETWRTGVPADAISKLDMPRYNAISAEAFNMSGTAGQAVDLLGTTVRLPGRALITEDAFFKSVGNRMELMAQAYRHRQQLMEAGVPAQQATTEAAAMLRHPPEQWRDAADSAARAMTFQQEMGPTLQYLATVMQHPLAKVFVPFFTTPTNVFRAALHRTPMSFFLSPQVMSDIRAGGARADLAMGRIALGSMAMWWMYGQVADSMADPDFRITGARPPERGMQQAWDRQGLAPYSVCQREDGRWSCHSYARVDPVSALLGMAADMAHHVAANPSSGDMADDVTGMALAAAAGLYEYTLEQPFAQGISDVAKILTERQAEAGSSRVERAAGLFAEKLAGAVLMPLTGGTLMGAIERAGGPETVNTMPEDMTTANANPIRRGFDRALQQARGRIPGESGELQPRLNIWGETVRPTEGGFLPLFWPFRMTSGRADALEDRLMALGGVLTMPDDKFPQTNVRMTAGQFNWIVRHMAGDQGAGTMREEMVALVEGPGFGMLDPKDQIAALRRIRETRLKAAREAALEEFPDLNRLVTRDREVRAVMGRSPPVEVE
jgi:hypothetical protein